MNLSVVAFDTAELPTTRSDMTATLKRLWLWLWHLLPANPILVRVVYGASRRQRHLWLRLAYLGLLLIVVMSSLVNAFVGGQSASLAELAKGASQTFKYASITQLLLMCFLAPIFTASAITQERDAQTFNILLSTPLSSGQIVLGSLMSRLYFVIMLLLAGLPIFLITMVYGGVTSRQIISSFLLAGATAILTGALAIFVAMVGVGTRKTIFSFYLLIALYLLAVGMLGWWKGTWVEASPPNIFGTKMSWLAPLHPFLALDVALNRVQAPPFGQLGGHGGLARYALAHPGTAYITWTLLLAAILVTSSMFFVRRGAKIGEPTFFTMLKARLRLGGPGERTRPPRSVWANPIAWREAVTRASGGMILRWGVILSGLAASIYIFVRFVDGTLVASDVPVFLGSLTIIQFAVALIIATNTASTSITKEKESKTMDLLLATPLTSTYILWGKLRGLVSFAVPLLVGPVIVLLVFAVYGFFRGGAFHVISLEAALELAVLMVLYTAVACVIGLRMSLTSRTNMIAVMSSIGIVVLLCGLVSMIGFSIIESSSGEFGAFVAPFTPFTAIQYLVNPAGLFDSVKDFADTEAATRTAAFSGCLVAAAMYAFVVWRWYLGLVRNFDMTMRKQSGQ